MDTLEELTTKRNVYRSISHSDQGFQYTSINYHQTVEQLGMIGSHSRKGNCHDNACIESFFSHFKSECLYLLQDNSEEEIIQAVEQYIYFYNNLVSTFQIIVKEVLKIKSKTAFDYYSRYKKGPGI